jgi:hypothetical protein
MAQSSRANFGDEWTQVVFIAEGSDYVRSLPRLDVAGKEKLPQSTFGIDCSKALARVSSITAEKTKRLVNPGKMSDDNDDP